METFASNFKKFSPKATPPAAAKPPLGPYSQKLEYAMGGLVLAGLLARAFGFSAFDLVLPVALAFMSFVYLLAGGMGFKESGFKDWLEPSLLTGVGGALVCVGLLYALGSRPDGRPALLASLPFLALAAWQSWELREKLGRAALARVAALAALAALGLLVRL